MINVLHVMAGADAGGISTVVLNYYKYVDRRRIHFDVALTTDVMGINGAQLQELGATFYRLPRKSDDGALYRQQLERLIRENGYQAIHVHENETSYVALQVAKRLGVPCRVAHAHSSAPYVSLKGELRRWSGCLLNGWYGTNLIACGELAGRRIFGGWNMRRKKAMVLPNAIQVERFAHDPELREGTRSALDWEGKFVMGMVGRLAPEKNNQFALRLLEAVARKRDNVLLVMVGSGPEEEGLAREIARRGLETRVLLLGKREDVDALYQAFDLFLLPSLHEGFPMAAVEAMAAGLPVLLSDTVTRELSFGSKVRYLSLHHLEDWVQAVCSTTDESDRTQGAAEVMAAGLDVTTTAGMLEQIYLESASKD